MQSLIARFMGPTWGPPGADRTQVGPMNFAIWVYLYTQGMFFGHYFIYILTINLFTHFNYPYISGLHCVTWQLYDKARTACIMCGWTLEHTWGFPHAIKHAFLCHPFHYRPVVGSLFLIFCVSLKTLCMGQLLLVWRITHRFGDLNDCWPESLI